MNAMRAKAVFRVEEGLVYQALAFFGPHSPVLNEEGEPFYHLVQVFDKLADAIRRMPRLVALTNSLMIFSTSWITVVSVNPAEAAVIEIIAHCRTGLDAIHVWTQFLGQMSLAVHREFR